METNAQPGGDAGGSTTGGATGAEALKPWLEQIEQSLRGNEALRGFNGPNDLAKDYLTKREEAERLQGELKGSVKVPGEKATPEEWTKFYAAVGRPDKPEDYEFPTPPGGQQDPRMLEWARNTFHAANLTKAQATMVGKEWNTFAEALVKADQEHMDKVRGDAEAQLRKEVGDDAKYKASLALADRMWKKVMGEDFTEFMKKTGFVANPYPVIKFILETAKVTGEDFSPRGSSSGAGEVIAALNYPNSPPPPQRR